MPLDAVQDAMMKMLGYRDRTPAEWTPLFWSILRNRITDMQRRGLFRLRWMLPGSSNAAGDPIGPDGRRLTPEQAEYLGVPVEGPYKPEHYRY